MSATTTHQPKEGATMFHTTDTTTDEPTETRHYELFDIRWDDGASWTGFETLDLAWASLTGSPREGHVERRTWSVEIPAHLTDLYRPGIDPDGDGS